MFKKFKSSGSVGVPGIASLSCFYWGASPSRELDLTAPLAEGT